MCWSAKIYFIHLSSIGIFFFSTLLSVYLVVYYIYINDTVFTYFPVLLQFQHVLFYENRFSLSKGPYPIYIFVNRFVLKEKDLINNFRYWFLFPFNVIFYRLQLYFSELFFLNN